MPLKPGDAGYRGALVASCVFFITYVLITNAVLLSVFLGIISISLETTIRQQQANDADQRVVRYFKKLFPGNAAKIKAIYRSFVALDIDSDGSISASELAYAYSVVMGVSMGRRTAM